MYDEFVKNYSLSFLYPCTFLWRKEKNQKKHALQLGLRLPSRKHFFRRGQELARLRRGSNSLPAVFEKTVCARLSCNGRNQFFFFMSDYQSPFFFSKTIRFLVTNIRQTGSKTKNRFAAVFPRRALCPGSTFPSLVKNPLLF